jgi:hypothetical protein
MEWVNNINNDLQPFIMIFVSFYVSEYVREDDMIPRNASVIISRVPVGGIAKTSAW